MKLITQQILNLFIGRTLTPQAKSPVTRGLWLVLPVLVFTGLTAPAIDYPPISSFLYGNTGVNAPAQTNAVSGDGYPYRLLLPPNYNPATHYPLIVYLHGGGEVGRDNVRQLTAGRNTANGGLALVSTENQSNYPCLFAAPQMSSNSWYYAASVQRGLQPYRSFGNPVFRGHQSHLPDRSFQRRHRLLVPAASDQSESVFLHCAAVGFLQVS